MKHEAPEAGGTPVALSIAGSDSGGGAGIQADLRAFAFFKTFGTTAITAITAQNPRAVTDVHPVPPASVTNQIQAVFAAFSVGAVKTGMLFNAGIIEAVAAALAARPSVPVVVDPVMVATSGARLLREDATKCLNERLLPLATVITPNIPEAEILAGRPLDSDRAVLTAAHELAQRFACTVMIKGGHHAAEPGTDLVSDGVSAWRLTAASVVAPSTHGTGCALSAGIAAGLAQGNEVLEAIVRAKAFVHGSLQNCVNVGPELWAMASPEKLSLDLVRYSQV